MVEKVVRPFYSPPTMIAKQAGSFLAYTYLLGWTKALDWLFPRGFMTLPVSAGAIGMGCIGYPNHPVWEITSACNERCLHCHASGGKPGADELTTEEGFRLIEQIAECNEFRMLVYTGGEPLVRKDLFDLLAYSKAKGFINVIATNAIDIDDNVAKELRKLGVYGLAISLDHTNPDVHNNIRQRKDAFSLALRGIDACRKHDIALQINVTAMEYNLDDIENVLKFADERGASIVLCYQLVDVGRGSEIKDKTVSAEKNKILMNKLVDIQKKISPVVEPVASPQYWPNLLINRGMTKKWQIDIFKKFFYGCTAGNGFVYIKPNGDVWPCPFVEVNAGNVREKSFKEIYRNADIFKKLRDRSNYGGDCGVCRFNAVCGGCRGKAWTAAGDCLGEDPTCFIDKSLKSL